MNPEIVNPEIPQTPQIIQPVEKKKFPWLVVLISILLGIVLTILSYVLYLQFIQKENVAQNQNNNEQVTGYENDVNDNEKVLALALDKLYYIKNDDGNIYSYDLNSKSTLRLTNHSSDYQIRTLAVAIIGDYVSYGGCNTVEGDYGCSLRYFDLKNNEDKELLKLSSDRLLSIVNMYSLDQFAYLESEYNKEALGAYNLIYVNDGLSKVIERIEVGQEYGRGGTYEDSEKITFSPDGKSILHISTSSPRNVLDFNTHVYNLGNGTKQVIPNSTHPTWLNNESIIYKNQKASEAGIYTYDLKSKKTVKLDGISKNGFNPKISSDSKSLVYTDYSTQKVYQYNLESKTNTKILDNAIDAIWVSNDTVLYQAVGKCVTDSDCFMTPYKYLNINLYNVNDKSNLDLKLQGAYSRSSLVDNR